MRRTFAKLIHEKMKNDDRIVVVTADLGYMMWDQIKTDFPERFFNCGSAEQLMISLAVGMTYEKKIPICYSITSFLLCRPFEMIRNYINHELSPVKLVGCGRNKEYKHDGFSHWANDENDILNFFCNLNYYKPKNNESLNFCFDEFLYNEKPSYMSLSKELF
jgi:transketolase